MQTSDLSFDAEGGFSAQIKDRDFILFGIQNWHSEHGGNNLQNIALEIAKNNRVLFVNLPLDRFSLMKNRNSADNKSKYLAYKGAEKPLSQLHENLWILNPSVLTESINWIKIPWVFDKLNYQNNKKFADQISSTIKKLGFDSPIIINDNEMFRGLYLKELLNPALYIYYMRDFLTAVDYWSFHGKRLEPQIAMKADLTISNSHYYADYLKEFNSASYYVGQGCDLEHYINSQLSGISVQSSSSEPIIGYVGALDSRRLDIDILVHIAKARPEWRLVLVGREDEEFQNSELHALPNVHFKGFVDFKKVPAIMQGFDICLNPQGKNPLTVGNYPLKVDEYLAMGKPVIATATQGMKVFEGYSYLAHNKEEYVTLIEKALLEDNDDLAQSRREFATSHSWKHNIERIYAAIKHFNNKNVEAILDSVDASI